MKKSLFATITLTALSFSVLFSSVAFAKKGHDKGPTEDAVVIEKDAITTIYSCDVNDQKVPVVKIKRCKDAASAVKLKNCEGETQQIPQDLFTQSILSKINFANHKKMGGIDKSDIASRANFDDKTFAAKKAELAELLNLGGPDGKDLPASMKNKMTLLVDEMQSAYAMKDSPERKKIEDEYYDACFSVEKVSTVSERCQKALTAFESIKDRRAAVKRIETKVGSLIKDIICNKDRDHVLRESEHANHFMFEVLKDLEQVRYIEQIEVTMPAIEYIYSTSQPWTGTGSHPISVKRIPVYRLRNGKKFFMTGEGISSKAYCEKNDMIYATTNEVAGGRIYGCMEK